MSRRSYDDLPEINSLLEIPKFASEAEEAEFWDTHALGPGLLTRMKRKTPLAKPIGPMPAGILPRLPVEALRTRLAQLALETAILEELTEATESRVLRWMHDYGERAPEWLLRGADALDATSDALHAEQQDITAELRRRGQSL